MYTIFAYRDGLGGVYCAGPTKVSEVDTERDAALAVKNNHDWHAVAPNGDVIAWDGSGVSRYPSVDDWGIS